MKSKKKIFVITSIITVAVLIVTGLIVGLCLLFKNNDENISPQIKDFIEDTNNQNTTTPDIFEEEVILPSDIDISNVIYIDSTYIVTENTNKIQTIYVRNEVDNNSPQKIEYFGSGSNTKIYNRVHKIYNDYAYVESTIVGEQYLVNLQSQEIISIFDSSYNKYKFEDELAFIYKSIEITDGVYHNLVIYDLNNQFLVLDKTQVESLYSFSYKNKILTLIENNSISYYSYNSSTKTLKTINNTQLSDNKLVDENYVAGNGELVLEQDGVYYKIGEENTVLFNINNYALIENKTITNDCTEANSREEFIEGEYVYYKINYFVLNKATGVKKQIDFGKRINVDDSLTTVSENYLVLTLYDFNKYDDNENLIKNEDLLNQYEYIIVNEEFNKVMGYDAITYGKIIYFDGTNIITSGNSDSGILNIDGQLLDNIDTNIYHISGNNIYNNMFQISSVSGTGVSDINGNVVVSPVFESVSPIFDGHMIGYNNGQYYNLNLSENQGTKIENYDVDYHGLALLGTGLYVTKTDSIYTIHSMDGRAKYSNIIKINMLEITENSKSVTLILQSENNVYHITSKILNPDILTAYLTNGITYYRVNGDIQADDILVLNNLNDVTSFSKITENNEEQSPQTITATNTASTGSINYYKASSYYDQYKFAEFTFATKEEEGQQYDYITGVSWKDVYNYTNKMFPCFENFDALAPMLPNLSDNKKGTLKIDSTTFGENASILTGETYYYITSMQIENVYVIKVEDSAVFVISEIRITSNRLIGYTYPATNGNYDPFFYYVSAAFADGVIIKDFDILPQSGCFSENGDYCSDIGNTGGLKCEDKHKFNSFNTSLTKFDTGTMIAHYSTSDYSKYFSGNNKGIQLIDGTRMTYRNFNYLAYRYKTVCSTDGRLTFDTSTKANLTFVTNNTIACIGSWGCKLSVKFGITGTMDSDQQVRDKDKIDDYSDHKDAVSKYVSIFTVGEYNNNSLTKVVFKERTIDIGSISIPTISDIEITAQPGYKITKITYDLCYCYKESEALWGLISSKYYGNKTFTIKNLSVNSYTISGSTYLPTQHRRDSDDEFLGYFKKIRNIKITLVPYEEELTIEYGTYLDNTFEAFDSEYIYIAAAPTAPTDPTDPNAGGISTDVSKGNFIGDFTSSELGESGSGVYGGSNLLGISDRGAISYSTFKERFFKTFYDYNFKKLETVSANDIYAIYNEDLSKIVYFMTSDGYCGVTNEGFDYLKNCLFDMETNSHTLRIICEPKAFNVTLNIGNLEDYPEELYASTDNGSTYVKLEKDKDYITDTKGNASIIIQQLTSETLLNALIRVFKNSTTDFGKKMATAENLPIFYTPRMYSTGYEVDGTVIDSSYKTKVKYNVDVISSPRTYTLDYSISSPHDGFCIVEDDLFTSTTSLTAIPNLVAGNNITIPNAFSYSLEKEDLYSATYKLDGWNSNGVQVYSSNELGLQPFKDRVVDADGNITWLCTTLFEELNKTSHTIYLSASFSDNDNFSYDLDFDYKSTSETLTHLNESSLQSFLPVADFIISNSDTSETITKNFNSDDSSLKSTLGFESSSGNVIEIKIKPLSNYRISQISLDLYNCENRKSENVIAKILATFNLDWNRYTNETVFNNTTGTLFTYKLQQTSTTLEQKHGRYELNFDGEYYTIKIKSTVGAISNSKYFYGGNISIVFEDKLYKAESDITTKQTVSSIGYELSNIIAHACNDIQNSIYNEETKTHKNTP